MAHSPLLARIRESNRQARDAWVRWARHRARVMEVLAQVNPADGHLALLGAGHLHDVDLGRLRARFRRITLVDLDPGPVTEALDRAGADRAGCVVHAPVDLTGAIDLLDEVGRRPDGPALLQARFASSACAIRGAPFDVTVSLGVLTQLMQAVTDAGVEASQVPALSLAVRDKHLRDVVGLTRPGGTAVLVTDFVSSTTAPGLLSLPEEALEPALARLVEDGNFFTGTNPYRLVALLEDEPAFRTDIERARFIGPWWWPVTSDRQHLAGAIVAERRPGG